MKKLALSLCAVIALSSAAIAGTETYSKESKSVTPPPCPEWYADKEFNLGVSGIYAVTGNEWRDDRYLVADHAWGGGIDAKYFVHRYFGFGVEGFLVRPSSHDIIDNGFTRTRIGQDERTVGSVMGTFTLRFPVACTRYAPYFWLGGGAIWGGGQDQGSGSDQRSGGCRTTSSHGMSDLSRGGVLPPCPRVEGFVERERVSADCRWRLSSSFTGETPASRIPAPAGEPAEGGPPWTFC